MNDLPDFLVDRHNILFQQQDISGKRTAAVAYGDDAEVSFHRLEGIEYMAAELRLWHRELSSSST